MGLLEGSYIIKGIQKMSLCITVKTPVIRTVEFANSTDPEEVAHNESSHPGLCCFPLQSSI